MVTMTVRVAETHRDSEAARLGSQLQGQCRGQEAGRDAREGRRETGRRPAAGSPGRVPEEGAQGPEGHAGPGG